MACRVCDSAAAQKPAAKSALPSRPRRVGSRRPFFAVTGRLTKVVRAVTEREIVVAVVVPSAAAAQPVCRIFGRLIVVVVDAAEVVTPRMADVPVVAKAAPGRQPTAIMAAPLTAKVVS